MTDPTNVIIIGTTEPLAVGDRITNGIVTDKDKRGHLQPFVVVGPATEADWRAQCAVWNSPITEPIPHGATFWRVITD